MRSPNAEQAGDLIQVSAEELSREINALETQLTALEKKSALSSPMVRAFGRQFGLGTSGKINWVRFKLNFLKEERTLLEAPPGQEVLV